MKKSLIALAVVGSFAAQAAMADVTVYGQANMSFDAVSTGTTTNSVTNNHVASNVSRLGFKGSEDLGDGLSAVFQMEQQVNMDTTSNNSGTRNTYVGLSSATMGTLLAGVHDTPYKIATRGADVFADTIADNRSIMSRTVGLNLDARLTNVVAYISPAMSGFTVAVATVAGAESATSGDTKGGAWSLAAMYNAGPINASLAYQAIDIGSVNSGGMGATATTGGVTLPAGVLATSKVKSWKLGGGYTMDQIVVNAVYEKISSTIAGSGSDLISRTNWYLSGKYNINANDAVKAAYTSAGKENNVTNTEATQFSVGYDHSLSKRTTVYALYTKITNKAAAGQGGAYTFSQSTSTPTAATDADPSAWSIGMKHAF